MQSDDLIILIGVVSRNGTLIVKFASQLQIDRGYEKRRAVLGAATIRLRLIITGLLALIFATVPLLVVTVVPALQCSTDSGPDSVP